MPPLGRNVTRWARGLAALAALAVAGCAAGAPAAGAPTASGSRAVSGSQAPAGTAGATAPAVAITPPGGWNGRVDDAQDDGYTLLDYTENPNTGAQQSALQTYTSAGRPLITLPPAVFTAQCGAADLVNSRGRLLITLLVTSKPAEGINPGSYSVTMTARSAVTGVVVWSTALATDQDSGGFCGGAGAPGLLPNFVSTLDGHWGIIELPDETSLDAVNLADGALYPHADLQGVLGNDLATGASPNGDSPVPLAVTVPGNWPQLGSTGASGGPQLASNEAGNGTGPISYAPTGFVGQPGTDAQGAPDEQGVGSVATPDGGYLVTVNTGQNSTASEEGYALPSLRPLWTAPVPQDYADTIVGVSNSTVLVLRPADVSGNPATLLALSPQTGKVQWQTNVGDGVVCDLTTSQVLLKVDSQLAVLSAATGKQLSYQQDPDVDQGGAECPTVMGTGLTGLAEGGSRILAP